MTVSIPAIKTKFGGFFVTKRLSAGLLLLLFLLILLPVGVAAAPSGG
jgi:hypothetical protein